MVEYSARHGIEPLPVVTYAPPWARVEPNELGSAPSNYQAYADFLKLLIARYGPDGQFWKEKPDVPYRPVRNWQIWNEPGVRYQWSPQTDWPRKYGELLKLAYATVKQADPGAKVVMAGLANASWEEMDALYDQGGVKGNFDIAGVHYYTKTASAVPGGDEAAPRASIDPHGDRRIPIWWTEAGASASKGKIKSPGNEHFQTTDEGPGQAAHQGLHLFIRNRSKLRIQRVYWYTWASSYRQNARRVRLLGHERLRRPEGDAEAVARGVPEERAHV